MASLNLAGKTSGYVKLQAPDDSSNNPVVTLPTESGELALKSDITGGGSGGGDSIWTEEDGTATYDGDAVVLTDKTELNNKGVKYLGVGGNASVGFKWDSDGTNEQLIAVIDGTYDFPITKHPEPLKSNRNIIINGDLKIRQRGKNTSEVATGEYGWDRWKKTDGGMTQIIEDINFEPNTEYTLSGENVTTQKLTSPSSGHWTLPDIPLNARNIQLEKGNVATPFEHIPYDINLIRCKRYYQMIACNIYVGNGSGFFNSVSINYAVEMCKSPKAEAFQSEGKTEAVNQEILEDFSKFGCRFTVFAVAQNAFATDRRAFLDAEL